MGWLKAPGSHHFARQVRTSLNSRAVVGQTFFYSGFKGESFTVAAVCYGEGDQTAHWESAAGGAQGERDLFRAQPSLSH